MRMTFSVDGRTVEKARRVAGAGGTTLNRMVRNDLERLAGQDEAERHAAEFRRPSRLGNPDPSWTFSRDAIDERGRDRPPPTDVDP